MLVAENIVKHYGNLQVLKGVSLEVQQGEIVSIVGASGAGKSTLLHILGTLDNPDQGGVRMDGKDVFSLKGSSLARFRNEHIGFVFQFHNLLPEFSALENVCMPGFLGGRNEKLVKSRAEELLGMLGLSNRLQHKPSQLSGGEQQRVSVARALLNNPKVVFADEPSGNLDSKSAQELHELFFRLREETGQTFVIVTHNEELANMTDRKLVMADGQL